jgi:hypothetical protein
MQGHFKTITASLSLLLIFIFTSQSCWASNRVVIARQNTSVADVDTDSIRLNGETTDCR